MQNRICKLVLDSGYTFIQYNFSRYDSAFYYREIQECSRALFKYNKLFYCNYRRNAPGLFASVACNYIIIFPASEHIRTYDSPSVFCQFWDEVMHDFWHVSGYRKGNWIGSQTKEMFVYDVQIVNG